MRIVSVSVGLRFELRDAANSCNSQGLERHKAIDREVVRNHTRCAGI